VRRAVPATARELAAAAPATRELAAVVRERAELAVQPERRVREARPVPDLPARAVVALVALGAGPAAARGSPVARGTPAPSKKFVFPITAVRSPFHSVVLRPRRSASTTHATAASATLARRQYVFPLAETASGPILPTSYARCPADEHEQNRSNCCSGERMLSPQILTVVGVLTIAALSACGASSSESDRGGGHGGGSDPAPKICGNPYCFLCG